MKVQLERKLNFGPLYLSHDQFVLNKLNCAAVAQNDLFIYDFHSDQLLFQINFDEVQDLNFYSFITGNGSVRAERVIQLMWSNQFDVSQDQPNLIVKTIKREFIVEFRNLQYNIKQIDADQYSVLQQSYSQEIIEKLQQMEHKPQSFPSTEIKIPTTAISLMFATANNEIYVNNQVYKVIQGPLNQIINNKIIFVPQFKNYIFKIYDLLTTDSQLFVLLSTGEILQIALCDLSNGGIFQQSQLIRFQQPLPVIQYIPYKLLSVQGQLKIVAIQQESQKVTQQSIFIYNTDVQLEKIEPNQELKVIPIADQNSIQQIKFCWKCNEALVNWSNILESGFCKCGGWFM
ncbi:Conserved_hypothetical protein [Hexamita inflata]|uniref:Uncharacterized protein n=1 Tax=Hexamita inflata TaxID=28002 RepID=A0AA86U7V6_9EUKA|nr:Conserved hypothetical protein [Hexamita inflata]